MPGLSGDAGNLDAVNTVNDVPRPSVGDPARNFEVPDNVENLAPATDKAKILANIEAIRLLKQLEDERRNATPEEKTKLAAYTGWGAFKEAFNSKYEEAIATHWDSKPTWNKAQYMPDWLQSWEKNHRPLHKLLRENMTEDEFASASASTLNAHYTAAPIIRAMWKMVERLGFTGGRALEPSAGAGHYLGLTPGAIADRTQWQTVELDDLSARLLSKLYPEATVNEARGGMEGRQVSGLGFERARIPNGSIDLIISNVPFHESGPKKKGFPNLNLHNFFFAHALDKVKPGGLVAFITSESTMQNNMKQRDFIASKGDLVAAFRLPNNAFKGNAGTEVTTDIIILRKPDGKPFQGKAWRNLIETGRQTITLVQGKDQTAEELRREAERTGEIIGREYFKGGKKAIDVSAPIMVNEYFVNHPQHALGNHTLASTMYRAGGYALVAPDDLDVPAVLNDLASTLTPLPVTENSEPRTENLLADRDDKPFSFKEQDGKLYEVQPDGSMEEAEWSTNPDMVKTWRSWKRVSLAVEELVTAENSDGASDDTIEDLRRALNVAYDTHIATHKPVSRRFANAHKHLASDPGYPLTAALENEVVSVDPKTGKKTYTYKKAEIFTKRIGRPIVIPTKATSGDEALEMSLAWKGHIDPAYGASLLGSTVERFEMESLQRPDIFRNPETGTLEQGEEYLSGNVRQKLEAAQEAAKDDPAYQRNVEALTTAQPERKEIARISPVLGARWIPAPVYDAFIKEVLQGNDTVEYIPAGNSWIISGSGVYNTEEHGTERAGPFTLFKHALNMTEPLIYDGSGENRTFNPSATAAAKTALDKMRRAFIDFVKTSDVQVEQRTENSEPGTLPVWQLTEDAFNETNNSYVTPKHTGAYLKFPGLNTDYVYTKAHRRGVIARFLTTRRGMMAHGVGSGKTFNQIILAQEMRRLGLAKKPMIVVQNSTLGQFAKSYLKAYPAAKILVPTKADFQAQNRRKLVAKIATGNWDAIILPHSQFDLISNKDSAVKAYMDSQIDELMAIVNKEKDKAKVRDLEGMIKRLKDRRQGMLDQLKARQDTAVMWEDLGIDALIMDEAHNYKSLPIITRMGRVKGVPASSNSQRAINFMLKCRDVQSRTGGKNIFLATGTPIKNSMAEAYIMMQFMAPDILEAFHIHNFDDFATTYGQTVTEAEMAWGGTPKMETRFAKFQNGSALVTMIRTMFDVAFGNDKLGLDVPKIKGGEPEMVIVPATPAIDQFNAWTRNVNELWKKADPTEKEEYGAVPIQTMAAGIAAALDPRLLAPNVEDHPGSKVNEAVSRVSAIYKAGIEKKTTQIIFSDLRNPFSLDYLMPFTGHPFPESTGSAESTFDLYEDIQRKLIASGVPAKEIHLMKSGMTDTAKAALFEKVDAGEIRIIIGSTELLGVGVNIQTRLKAVHHLMPPRDFTPAMMEQRNGRIIRQGNLHAEKVEGKPAWNEEVEVVNYGTEGSMDSAIYGTLARKQRFITQLLMGEEMQDTFDDPTDPVAVNMAEMAARTLGDPDFIRRIELEKEIKDLRLQNEAFTNELSGKRSRLSRTEQLIRNGPANLAYVEKEAERAANLWKRTAPRPEGVREETDITDKPVYQFGGITIDTAAKDGAITNRLGTWLGDQSLNAERRGIPFNMGDMTINGHAVKIRIDITLPNTPTGGAIIGPDGLAIEAYSGPDSLIQKLRRLPAAAQEQVERVRRQLDQDTITARNLRALLASAPSTFPEAERLAALEREAQEVDARLREKSSPPPSENQEQGTKNKELPPLKPVDPGLMTYDVEQVIDNADIIGNKLFLPDTLDRKLYKKVNAALESAGGVWSKRDKAHLFAGDPRPYLGLAEMPSLAKGRISPDTPNREPRTENREQDRLDRRTAHATRIAGSRVTAEQGQALRDDHFARLLTGALRPDSPAASAAFDWSPGPRLARLLSEAFSAPILTPAQQAAIQSLPVNDEGVESMVYLDRENGVIYKKLKNYAEAPSGGIWPQVTWAGRSLSWSLQPANNPRAVGVRLAVMSDLGGTPTEVAAISPDGHIYLKQPLSSAPNIATDKGSHITVGTRHLAGLVEIPDKHLEPGSARAWMGIVNGRPWLVTDLHPANFIGDNQGDARINDPVIGVISMDVLKNVPGLGAVVQEANRRAQELGDRANRLFMSKKAVDTKNPALVSQGGAGFTPIRVESHVSIRSPKADAVLPAVESVDSFQSAPELPATGPDYNRYEKAQGERLRAARNTLNDARETLNTENRKAAEARAKWHLEHGRQLSLSMPEHYETIAKAWKPSEFGGWNSWMRPSYNRSWQITEKAFIEEAQKRGFSFFSTVHHTGNPRLESQPSTRIERQGVVLVDIPGFDNASWVEPESVQTARDRIIEAEAALYLAEEEDAGQTDRLAAMESAAEWARRTRAAEFAALLDARDEQAKNAASYFVAQVWQAYAAHDEAFQFGKSQDSESDSIAEAVSLPGRQITAQDRGDTVRFMGPNGYLDIHNADTKTPYIRSADAASKGKKGGGGTQLYQAALDWIHNNGKRIKDDPGGLTSINSIRRTSNFFSSALRWGTTKHLKPHANQGLKWTKSDTRNIAALAAREMEFTFKAIAEARDWRYDFARDAFLDSTGQTLDSKRIESAVTLSNPGTSGIGLSTLERAVITSSALEAFQRGEAESVVSQIGGRESLPDGLTGVLYKGTTAPSPLAALGWNHLDRSASAKLAALTRWTNETTKAGELVAKWQSAPLAAPFMKWGHILKKELFPDSVLPREIAAKKREMEIKTAMGGQRAMDLVRALSGSPKFSDIAYPPEFAANPIWRTRLYSAMTGEAPMSSLPAPLQALAAKLRAMLVEIGQEAVKQGRMSLDTFEMLREGYMPHYYKEDVAREKSLIQRFRLAVRDLLGARTSAWHIVDTQNRERGSGDFRAVEWQPGKWRFRNKEHRDAHYEDFILSQALTQIHAMGGKARTLTVSDLRAPAALSGEVRGALDVIKRQLRTRYQKEAPLSLDAHQKAGLIMDPVYAIARYAAQQAHDNSTAEFFNFVAADPQNISDVASAGFTEVPDNPRYGRLAGKYVTDDVAHQILEMIEAPGDALRAYDTILGWWKTGKTVLNPGTHVRNVLGNVFFSQLAGNSVWNPGNTRYYRDALRAMRNGGPDLMEAYEQGVLGADFVSVELRQTLRQLLPDPATIDEGKPVLGIGKSIGQFAAKVIGNPAHKAYNQIAALYQAEDELFKLAAYLKAKAIFAQQGTRNEELGTMAAGHVRKWFPYFDSGSSATLRTLGRTAMPFLGFYRESIRIFGHALAERPLALAAGLAVPSIITVLSAMALGLDDDELEQVRKDMRGKGAKLLGPTPLGGVPLFSMLLPERSDQGQLQQFDISAIHPFVDFMGNRVEGGENEDWYQKAWRSFIAAGPIGSLIYSQMTGKDTFGDRTFVEQNMTPGEKITARLDNIAKTLLPPLAPGGTGLASLMKAGERQTNKTFETRSPTQTVLRSVVGLDVRNATPNLYRIADDWRKANGYEVQEGMDYGSTTPASRARAALFAQLAQDEPNEKAIANIKARLAEMGHPITSPQDVNKLLFYRDPLKIIGGDQKRGISAKEAQQQFQASLTGLDRETLAAAQAEYEKIKARAPMLLLK